MDEVKRRNPRGQGDRGELIAATWYAEQGASVFIPLLHTSRDYDFVADWGGRLDRVQVKTTSLFRCGRWEATLCTRGGNRSWNGIVKRLDPERYDALFLVVGDGRRWLMPSHEVEGGAAIRLGGPRYAAFEIDPGPPLITSPRR